MLASFRRFADTLPAKVFFAVLVASFAFWGVADGVRNATEDRAVAVVGSKRITPDELSPVYQRSLQQALHSMGTTLESTPEIRRGIASQTLERMITIAALQSKAESLGLGAPDSAVRDAVYEVPSFRGANGAFDKATFQEVLRSNGYTEKRFLDEVRSQVLINQLLLPLRADAVVSDTLANGFFKLQFEKRVALAVELPFRTAAQPAAPTPAQLQRFYENNTSRYVTKETRRVRAIVLAPETLSSEVLVDEADIARAYEARRADFITPEKRSVQVLIAQSEDVAKSLAAQWTAQTGWDKIQDIAQKAGAGPVELTDATQVEFPSPELGQAVFAAQANTVGTPVKGALGWYVIKVTGIAPGSARGIDEVKGELRAKLAADKAVDLLYVRANKIEDALAAGTSLDNLPGDLGVAAVQGTLDAQGLTPDGRPAPIPGPAELRPALLQAIFKANKGDVAQLVQAPNGKDGTQSFYAFEVEDITPVATRAFADVQLDVRADWIRDAIRHAQEAVAATLLQSVRSGKTLEFAAKSAGLTATRLPPAGRDAPPVGVPPQLIAPLFSLKPGEAAMVETQAGFMVAVLDSVVVPDPVKDAADYARLKDELAKSLSGDLEFGLLTAVQKAANPKINNTLLNQMTQSE